MSKSKKNPASKMGRPPIDISKEAFESLCRIQCTSVEVAAFFKCSDDTITNWCKKEYGMTFSEVFKQYKSEGKVSLRRALYKSALSGNPIMLKHLSKNWLGLSEDPDMLELKREEVAIKRAEHDFRVLQAQEETTNEDIIDAINDVRELFEATMDIEEHIDFNEDIIDDVE